MIFLDQLFRKNNSLIHYFFFFNFVSASILLEITNNTI